MYQLYSSI